MSGLVEERDNNMEGGMDTYDESMMLGGAKLISGKSWVDGFFFMIKNAKKIECISTDSLYGFIFVVELKDGINNTVIPFQSITRGSSGNTHKIKKLLLKFSLVYETLEIKTDLKKFMKENPFNRKIKGIDTIKNFNAEVKKQIDVFQTTFTHGGLANCPSIVFDRACTNGESKIFLEMLLTRPTYVESCDMHSSTRNSLRYLYDVVSKKTELRLGLIAMEYAESTDSQTKNNKFVLFNQLYKRIDTENYDSGTDYVLYHRIALILSNMIILLLECGIVHCDLHFNNVFVIDYTKNKKTILLKSNSCIDPVQNTTSKSCIRIIDFGRTTPDTYLKNEPGKKETFINSLKTYKKSGTPGKPLPRQSDRIKQATQQAYPDPKLYNYIREILQYIYGGDLIYTIKINPFVKVPQCAGYFILAGLVAQNPPGGQYTFVETSEYKVNTSMKYVMDLISGYLIDYYKLEKKETIAYGLYHHIDDTDDTDDTDPSFVSQLLKCQLETLRDSLELKELDYKSMTYTTSKTEPTEIVSYFDLVTSGGNSMREQRYDLKPLFASIDSIIQEITSITRTSS